MPQHLEYDEPVLRYHEIVAELAELRREVERENGAARRAWRESAPRAAELSPREKARLQSLGYVY